MNNLNKFSSKFSSGNKIYSGEHSNLFRRDKTNHAIMIWQEIATIKITFGRDTNYF